MTRLNDSEMEKILLKYISEYNAVQTVAYFSFFLLLKINVNIMKN